MAGSEKDFKFEIINNIGVFSGDSTSKWKKELNRVSWNGREPKYDLRPWSQDHTEMKKGLTLTEEELRNLKEVIDAEIAFLDSNEY